MKKLLFVFVLGAFASCGSSDNNKETMSDTSTVVTKDTLKVVTDTTVKTDTLNKK